MSDEMREAFEALAKETNVQSGLQYAIAKVFYQAATAAAEAKYREVIEKLVGLLNDVKDHGLKYDEKHVDEELILAARIDAGIEEAAPYLGRK